uniref:protein-serine/threonine phosphatase n=1 Tax=Strigamia maritima TaxID=126957 RepID=T1J880_STRMM
MWRSPTKLNGSCSIPELTAIITAPSGGYYLTPTDPYNEVFPGIFIGDVATALCIRILKRLGVTHVLNAAYGRGREFGFVNTDATFYERDGIKFLGIPAMDMMSFHLEPYFEEASEFIHQALRDKGKVLVHCRCGISRSSTLVLAYLMLKKGMRVQEALKTVRANREIIPNIGFLQQLCNLNDRLEYSNKNTHRFISSTKMGSNEKERDWFLYEGIVCCVPDIERTDDEEKHKFCVMCNKHLRNHDEALTHYLSKSHLNKIGIKKRNLFKSCNVCHMEFDTVGDFKKHISTDLHVEKMETLAKLRQLERKVVPNQNTTQFLVSVLAKNHRRDHDKHTRTRISSSTKQETVQRKKISFEESSLLKNKEKMCQVCDKWIKNFKPHN